MNTYNNEVETMNSKELRMSYDDFLKSLGIDKNKRYNLKELDLDGAETDCGNFSVFLPRDDSEYMNSLGYGKVAFKETKELNPLYKRYSWLAVGNTLFLEEI